MGQLGIASLFLLSLSLTRGGEDPEDDAAEQENEREGVDSGLGGSETGPFFLGDVGEGIVSGK